MKFAERQVAPRVVPASAAAGSVASNAARSVTHLLALQRKVGNAAVVRLLQYIDRSDQLGRHHFVTGTEYRTLDAYRDRTPQESMVDRMVPAIQRHAREDSDPRLLKHYNEMLNSQAFQTLDAKVTKADGPLKLVDSSVEESGSTEKNAIEYIPVDHAIYAPSDLGEKELRAALLFELHNAADRHWGELDSRLRPAEAPQGSSRKDDGNLDAYRQAAYALATEWGEWVRAAEFDVRSARIDSDLGRGDSYLERHFDGFFTVPNDGWFLFDEYLDYQKGGHLEFYDEAASEPGWLGEELVKIGHSKSTSAMKISQEEWSEFQSGRRERIKNPEENPFRDPSLLSRVARYQLRPQPANPNNPFRDPDLLSRLARNQLPLRPIRPNNPFRDLNPMSNAGKQID